MSLISDVASALLIQTNPLFRNSAPPRTVSQSNEQELKTQRQMLSPRALQQGWKEELDSNIGQHREWITRRKLEAVFDATLPARQLEEEVRRIPVKMIIEREKTVELNVQIIIICCILRNPLLPVWSTDPYTFRVVHG